MAEIIEHEGTPVVVGRERYHPILRIRANPRKLKDKPFKNMNEQQRQALRNIAEMEIEHKKEAVTAAGVNFHIILTHNFHIKIPDLSDSSNGIRLSQ